MAVITRQVYTILQSSIERLQDDVTYNIYTNGKGSPGSPAKILRAYGFLSKSKKKLLKEVTVFLNTCEIV